MCGIAYSSLMSQLAILGEPDPSGFSPKLVVTVKAVGMLLGVAGLVSALIAAPAPSLESAVTSSGTRRSRK